jgi:hypothetical protein
MTFSQKQQDLQLTVDALEEALEDVIEDNTRLRNNVRILRTVNSGLRSKLAIAHKNDEAFVSACQEDVIFEAIEPESDATGYSEDRSEDRQDYPQGFQEYWGIGHTNYT